VVTEEREHVSDKHRIKGGEKKFPGARKKGTDKISLSCIFRRERSATGEALGRGWETSSAKIITNRNQQRKRASFRGRTKNEATTFMKEEEKKTKRGKKDKCRQCWEGGQKASARMSKVSWNEKKCHGKEKILRYREVLR